MKIGLRKPSLKKSFKARTTGKLKRQAKKALIPGYGKKGMGMISDPKKSVYNKVYNRTTIGIGDSINSSKKSKKTDNERIIQFNRQLNILNDCAKLLETTKNPDVFFTRFKLYMDTLEWLAENEKNFNLKGELPSIKLIKMKQTFVSNINEFIDTYYESTKSHIDTLKTEKAKINNCLKFKSTLEQYNDYMHKDNVEYYTTLYDSLKDSI